MKTNASRCHTFLFSILAFLFPCVCLMLPSPQRTSNIRMCHVYLPFFQRSIKWSQHAADDRFVFSFFFSAVRLVCELLSWHKCTLENCNSKSEPTKSLVKMCSSIHFQLWQLRFTEVQKNTSEWHERERQTNEHGNLFEGSHLYCCRLRVSRKRARSYDCVWKISKLHSNWVNDFYSYVQHLQAWASTVCTSHC